MTSDPACPLCRDRGTVVMEGGRSAADWIEVGCPACHQTPPAPTEQERSAAVQRPVQPVGEHPAVAESGLCSGCLGAGTVLGTGLRSEPCPRCRPEAA